MAIPFLTYISFFWYVDESTPYILTECLMHNCHYNYQGLARMNVPPTPSLFFSYGCLFGTKSIADVHKQPWI